MRQDFYRSYRQAEILSADPLDLVRLLYREAIARIVEIRECLRRRDIAARAAAVSRVTAIIGELLLSLDRERGGDIAANLVELYDYMLRRINEGNFRQTDEPFAEVEDLLRTLTEAWEQCGRGESAVEEEAELYTPVSCAG